jgi:hypothetical protein
METRPRYVVRHWRGEIAPAIAVASFLAAIVTFYLVWVCTLNLPLLVENFGWQVVVMAALLLAAVIAGVWQIVGTWRALGKVILRERRLAGVLGRVMVLLIASVVAMWIVPAALETAQIIRGLATAADRYTILIDPARPNIVIFKGEIAWGSSRALAALLNDNRSVHVLELNSIGGSIVEAEKIASQIEARKLATHVGAICISACTLAYVSGAPRSASKAAKFGFHRFSASVLTSRSIVARLTLRYRQALLSQGVDRRFVDTALAIDPPQYWVPSARDLRLGGFVQVFVD